MKRWTLRITICLILGVVTTVGVAVLAHWFAPLTTFVAVDIDPETLEVVDTWAKPGAAPREMAAPDWALRRRMAGLIGLQTFADRQMPSILRIEPPLDRFRRVISMIWIEGPATDVVAGVSGLSEDTSSAHWVPYESGPVYGRFFADSNSPSALVKRTGWPLRIFEFDILQRFAPDPRGFSLALSSLESSGGDDVAMRSALDQTGIDATFPQRIMLTDAVVNTLFYAAIWFGLFFAPGMMGRTRRFIRTRRGRCPRCGYDLQHNLADGCSECGWNRATAENRA